MYIHPVMLKPNNQNMVAGFTLVECLVALAVLTMAIIPVLYLSNSAVNVAFNIRDDSIAAGLAQEGIEVVRSMRDTNWFAGQAFNNSLADGTYRVEWNSTSLIPISNNPPLNVNNGLYTYTGGTPSAFSRAVTITNVSAGEIKVVSDVTWHSMTASRSVSVEDHLFNWK